MSYFLTHLTNAWQVDQAIMAEEDRLVVIRFGHDYDPECAAMDETLYRIADAVAQWCVIYVVDVTQVPDFCAMYELVDACTLMVFWRNRHVQIDTGTGNNHKVTWAITDRQELVDLLEVVYRGARKGKGLVVSPRDYSRHRKSAEL